MDCPFECGICRHFRKEFFGNKAEKLTRDGDNYKWEVSNY
jgi:cytidine deaminase